MEQIELHVSIRKLMGKKSRFLRRQGIIPVHLYGHDTDPMSLQCETTQLKQVLKQAGRTKLVGLKIDNHRKPRKVVVREVQINPLTGELLHVDFFQVSMKEKIKVEVPVVVVGEPPALKSKATMLVHELHSMVVECLPDRIPESVRVDASVLVEEDQVVQVKDIVLGEGITILNNPEQVVIRIALLPTEKLEKPVAVEAEAAPPKAESAEAMEAGEAPKEAKESKKKEE